MNSNIVGIFQDSPFIDITIYFSITETICGIYDLFSDFELIFANSVLSFWTFTFLTWLAIYGINKCYNKIV